MRPNQCICFMCKLPTSSMDMMTDKYCNGCYPVVEAEKRQRDSLGVPADMVVNTPGFNYSAAVCQAGPMADMHDFDPMWRESWPGVRGDDSRNPFAGIKIPGWLATKYNGDDTWYVYDLHNRSVGCGGFAPPESRELARAALWSLIQSGPAAESNAKKHPAIFVLAKDALPEFLAGLMRGSITVTNLPPDAKFVGYEWSFCRDELLLKFESAKFVCVNGGEIPRVNIEIEERP